MLINPYQPGTVLRNFPTLYQEISKHYDLLYDTIPGEDFSVMTIRYKFEHGIKVGVRDVFYYIDCLYDNKPTSIIDVGCGECVWKTWFPNITGFDTKPSKWSKADFSDHFDECFSQGHKKNYTCGMALNSLHFIDWSAVPKQIDLAMNIVKDQFLFTFNFSVLRNKPNLPQEQLILLFDDILHSSNYKIKLLDYPTLRGIPQKEMDDWSHANGHVRFILQHNQ